MHLVARKKNLTDFLTGLDVFYSSSKKGKLDRFFDRLDRPVELSRPDRFPSLRCLTSAKFGDNLILCFLVIILIR